MYNRTSPQSFMQKNGIIGLIFSKDYSGFSKGGSFGERLGGMQEGQEGRYCGRVRNTSNGIYSGSNIILKNWSHYIRGGLADSLYIEREGKMNTEFEY